MAVLRNAIALAAVGTNQAVAVSPAQKKTQFLATEGKDQCDASNFPFPSQSDWDAAKNDADKLTEDLAKVSSSLISLGKCLASEANTEAKDAAQKAVKGALKPAYDAAENKLTTDKAKKSVDTEEVAADQALVTAISAECQVVGLKEDCTGAGVRLAVGAVVAAVMGFAMLF